MILPYQTIVQELGETGRIKPFFAEKQIFAGMSYGCSAAGYDVRIAQDVVIGPVGTAPRRSWRCQHEARPIDPQDR